MNTINIAICDDEVDFLQAQVDEIISCFAKYNIEAKVDLYNSPNKLLNAMDYNSYSIMFLDIEMPTMTGLDLGTKIREKVVGTIIIYLSSHEEKVFEVFPIQPFTFIRKSNFFEDIEPTIKRLVEKKQLLQSQTIEIRINGGLAFVSINELVYIECFAKHQFLYLSNGKKVEVRMTMNSLADQLCQYGFIRVHQGYIVNYRFIRSCSCERVVLDNIEIPISRRLRKEALQSYMRLSRQDKGILSLK